MPEPLAKTGIVVASVRGSAGVPVVMSPRQLQHSSGTAAAGPPAQTQDVSRAASGLVPSQGPCALEMLL